MLKNAMFENEYLYIAGPECFYENGFTMLGAMRKYVESLGFKVTLPNDNPLDMANPNLQKRADSIMFDLKKDIEETTVIIADLENFRGSEPDGGTIFEIGMAYARNLKCYGYTRDKRTIACKNTSYKIKNGVLLDEHNEIAPYYDLPFSPCVVGSTKIVEGNFIDCVNALIVDLEEESKAIGKGEVVKLKADNVKKNNEKPIVYLATNDRYRADGKQRYEKLQAICEKYGFKGVTPLDYDNKVSQNFTNTYAKAGFLFDSYQNHVRNADIIFGDLNDFKGFEPSNDVAFELGMGFQLGKTQYGFMTDTSNMIDRIPHRGSGNEYRDFAGCNVENFDYPINLMFSCAMDIIEGDAETALEKILSQII